MVDVLVDPRGPRARADPDDPGRVQVPLQSARAAVAVNVRRHHQAIPHLDDASGLQPEIRDISSHPRKSWTTPSWPRYVSGSGSCGAVVHSISGSNSSRTNGMSSLRPLAATRGTAR